MVIRTANSAFCKTVCCPPFKVSVSKRANAWTPNGRAAGSALIAELIVAMAILVAAVFPLSLSFFNDARALRAEYCRAVAMEIVDGEMEILMAGEWRAYSEGTHVYLVQAEAARNLPPGQFQLTRTGNHIRLEWAAVEKRGIGNIVREATVR